METLYKRTVGQWVAIVNKDAEPIALGLLRENLERFIDAKGYQRDGEVEVQIAQGIDFDHFSPGQKAVASRRCLLTFEQEWTLRIEEAERRIESLKAALAEAEPRAIPDMEEDLQWQKDYLAQHQDELAKHLRNQLPK
jgi:chromosome condensin MukBEF complex kleisin-like MukF subunit